MKTNSNNTKASQELQEHILEEFENLCIAKSENTKDKLTVIIDKVCNIENISDCMRKLKEYDYGTYIHSVRVGIICVAIGCIMGYEEQFIVELGAAGLLHDIGKKFLPCEVINKKEKLTQLEFIIVKYHAAMSAYYIMKKYKYFNETIVMGVYQHHERLDGSGYPRQLIKEEIGIPGRILAIADTFEAYSSNRAYHAARTINETIDFMNRLETIDKDIYKKFRRQINVEVERIEM